MYFSLIPFLDRLPDTDMKANLPLPPPPPHDVSSCLQPDLLQLNDWFGKFLFAQFVLFLMQT